jgi:hypothetical protein
MTFSPSYHVNRQETAFDERLKKVKKGEELAENATWDNAPAEVIRAQFERLVKTDQQRADAAASKQLCDVWVKTKPEFIDHPLNGRQLINQVRTMYGTSTPTLEMLETAYRDLLPTGLLDIDKAELARQKDLSDTQRAKEIKDAGGVYVHNHPSEEEMYSMDMEQLRMLGNNTNNAGGRGRL